VNAADAGDGDYELRLLRARLDAHPRDLKVRLELAEHYQKRGFTEIAIEHGRLACERAPESDEAHVALAKMLRGAGRSSDGAVVLKAYTAAQTGAGASVLGMVGNARKTTGTTGKRGKRLTARPCSRTGRDEFHNNLGYCLLRQGRHGEAAAEFRAALKLQPHSAFCREQPGFGPHRAKG